VKLCIADGELCAPAARGEPTCTESAASASASSTPDLARMLPCPQSASSTPDLAHMSSPKARARSRSRTFDLGSCRASIEPEYCASCNTEILPHRHSQVVFGFDLRFCSEGCRCVLLHSGMVGDMDNLGLEGKQGLQNPCMHHDQNCPHFASKSAGLVKHKFTEKSPGPSPVMHGVPCPLKSNLCSISLPPAMQLDEPKGTLTKSNSCEISRSGSGKGYCVSLSRTGSGDQSGASVAM